MVEPLDRFIAEADRDAMRRVAEDRKERIAKSGGYVVRPDGKKVVAERNGRVEYTGDSLAEVMQKIVDSGFIVKDGQRTEVFAY